ncbi:type IV pilus assembly protein PilX [Halopseudomonas xinjiangensis]|uniref:Type IV pilus assembly protein PilX n=1 Tax=Halopseudomonas xinjiangensis TaxID=487184 RepID=A0A1H1VY90_9GAMM|nr:PilX N-terminal domain-containing pilus assembly protein [Halopseudomonas xinjiangensis]SDS89705.1 type IV pilus assembly protein PilX [Halopseudomonas xinjiangensis]
MDNTFSRTRQQGTVLIVSLMLLVLLTMSSVAGIKASTSQERMAANARIKNDSFQAAEAGLRIAEQALASAPHSIAAPCAAEQCDLSDNALDIDHRGSPGSGWVSVPRSEATNQMDVWYRVVALGSALAPANTRSQAPGELYRILVVSFRGQTRTVLEATYAHTII